MFLASNITVARGLTWWGGEGKFHSDYALHINENRLMQINSNGNFMLSNQDLSRSSNLIVVNCFMHRSEAQSAKVKLKYKVRACRTQTEGELLEGREIHLSKKQHYSSHC